MAFKRKKLCLNQDWRFYDKDITVEVPNSHAESYGSVKAGGTNYAARSDFDDSDWQLISLPHDFVVSREFDPSAMIAQGYKQRGNAHYRKLFKLPEDYKDKHILIEFGGVSTYCTVFFNGSVLERNWDGYNSFVVDVTDRAFFGEKANTLALYVDAESFEGWWYEGGGIYRDVWLYVTNEVHIEHDGIFVNPCRDESDKIKWITHIDTSISSTYSNASSFELVSKIIDAKGTVLGTTSSSHTVIQNTKITQTIPVENPLLWDIDTPNLYQLVTQLYINSELVDEEVTKFGYRTIEFCHDTGFYLNDRALKIVGTCNHQDHAGVGVALTKEIVEYRVKRLKEMGSNAYRTAHGNSGILKEVCDEMGMLVMEENRVFESSKESLSRIESMVKNSRNHPSVFMYCIFNEEDLQGSPVGRKMSERMMRTIKELDNTRPISAAMNGGHFEDGVAPSLDIAGFNYQIHSFDAYHEIHPTQPIIATENNCALSTRGIYKTNETNHSFSCYDEEKAFWGNLARETWEIVNKRNYVSGYFVWTGFDYRGEPTPCSWPSINSHWGILDTCGFAKDSFYLHKALWTTEPMVHIVPAHWNFDDGEIVKVMSHTNCQAVELVLNGRSLGKKEIDGYKQETWDVAFEKGQLKMLGYIDNHIVASDEINTAGSPTKIKLTIAHAKQNTIIINAHTEDENNQFVPNSNHKITFSTSYNSTVLGVGNGNPTSLEVDKSNERYLFNGRCQAIIGCSDDCCEVTITAVAEGIAPCKITVPIPKTETREYVESSDIRFIGKWSMNTTLFTQRPDPLMKVSESDMNSWERIELGYGTQKIFDNKCGYAMYRTTFSLKEGSYTLLFNGIVGEVEIFENDLQILDRTATNGRSPIEVPLTQSGQITITVIVYAKDKGGINKTVALKQQHLK